MDAQFVTPAVQPAPMPAPGPQPYTLNYMSGLRTKLASDFWVAVGAGILTAVPLTLAGHTLERAAVTGGICALIVLGVRLTGLLHAGQAGLLIAWQQARIQTLHDANVRLAEGWHKSKTQLGNARLEIARLGSEVDTLRSQQAKGFKSAAQLEGRMRSDALALIDLAVKQGGWVARDDSANKLGAVALLGWGNNDSGRQRWDRTQEILLRAGIIQRNHRSTKILLTGDAALAALDRYSPDGDPTAGGR